MNNVVYYSWFDTVVNQYLILHNALDIQTSPIIGLVVETQCAYFSPVSFPDSITVGLAVTHLGNSSVRYELGVFKNDEPQAAAQGHFVHVYVDRTTRRPTSITPCLPQTPTNHSTAPRLASILFYQQPIPETNQAVCF